MKDYLRQIILETSEVGRKRALVREYLQARTLQMLQDQGAFANWAFVGGTALRFLFSLPRFSEDLDFSLVGPLQDLRFAEVLAGIKTSFVAETYNVRAKINDQRTVRSAYLIFDQLLFELSLSPHRSETVSIKIEIDTNPPPGAGLTTSIVRRFVILNLMHYDKASLFAGKLHAILTRKYTKGRDLYDLFWYLSDKSWPEPNLALLNSALKQTDPGTTALESSNWRQVLASRCTTLNWEKASADVQPFLERPQDRALLTKANVLKLLNSN